MLKNASGIAREVLPACVLICVLGASKARPRQWRWDAELLSRACASSWPGCWPLGCLQQQTGFLLAALLPESHCFMFLISMCYENMERKMRKSLVDIAQALAGATNSCF